MAARSEFGEALVALIPQLRAYAFALTRTTAEADDLVQDAIVRALRFRSRFAAGSNMRAWVFTILRNEFLSRVARSPRTVQDEEGRLAAQLVTPADQEWRVLYGQVLTALNQIPDETRHALLLVTAGGLTYEEAAFSCNCAVGTIKSRVNRARARLADLLEPPRERRVSSRATASLQPVRSGRAPGTPHAGLALHL